MTQTPRETLVRKAVRDRYAKLASQTECATDDCCGDSACCPAEANFVPSEAVQVSAGCGSPLAYAQIKEGETVVDLGSGGGIDVFRAAKLVGEKGRAIGIDATPEMIWRARETAAKDGYSNVEFRLGEIEHIPLEIESADWIISNCVINLAPNKEAVFRDAFRVLKPGGRLIVSDIVAETPIPEESRSQMFGWAACMTGAIMEEEYLNLLRRAGFNEVEVLERKLGVEMKTDNSPSTEKLKLASLTISARKKARR